MSISIHVDTRKFDKTFREYMKYSKRSIAEACNQHAYYIARDATMLTHGATKEEIAESLNADSKKYPNVAVAAILVNAERGKKGRKGLNGERMRNAVEKFIRKRQSHRNFIRSRWIPAIKKLATLVPRKNGSPIPPGTDKAGRNFGGGANPAKDSFGWHIFTLIWAAYSGKDHGGRVLKYLEKGAKEAIEMERLSMKQYIQRKLGEEAKRFWT